MMDTIIEVITKIWEIRYILVTIAIFVFLIMSLDKFVLALTHIKDFFGGKKQ